MTKLGQGVRIRAHYPTIAEMIGISFAEVEIANRNFILNPQSCQLFLELATKYKDVWNHFLNQFSLYPELNVIFCETILIKSFKN